jgi:hypothetical protein
MDRVAADHAVRVLLNEIRARLDEAARTAQAAQACAEAGNIEKGVEVALDIEQPVYEAGRLLDAASLIKRIRR